MRAAIHNPYLDTLGGGERYSLAVAKFLVKKGYDVDIEWKDATLAKKLEERFGIDLSGVRFIPDIKRGDGYDVCFWVSDGSIPTLLARKNFLHFQVPFVGVHGITLLNKMKIFRINKIICNSYFTKKFIDKEYGVNSLVTYPPVDVNKIKPGKKENLILYVGRFSQLTQTKRQDILIKVFKKLYDSGFRDWKLILAGGVEVGVNDLPDRLKKESIGYPVKIITSPSFKDLLQLYAKAKIFWSASGYEIDEQEEPQKVEHFGINVVEAMAAGVVPFAYKAGGHKEIIKDGINGYLWEQTSSLLTKTNDLIDDPKLLKKISLVAKHNAQLYSYERFENEFSKII